jgi:hypothetical protein
VTALDSRPGEGEAPGRACPSIGRHDTVAARLHDKCACPEAIAAKARYDKQWAYDVANGRKRLAPSIGAARRIQALYAIGWTGDAIGAELGVGRDRVRQIASRPRVRTATAAAVADLYRRLSNTPGPSRVTEGNARSRGYVPPIGWDDDTLDDPDAQPWMELHDDGARRPGRVQCARGDCRTWFAAGRKRIYCTPDCSRAAERERDRVQRRAYYRDRNRARRTAQRVAEAAGQAAA